MEKKTCPYCKGTNITTKRLNFEVEVMRASIVSSSPIDVNTCEFCSQEWTTVVNTIPAKVKKPRKPLIKKQNKPPANHLRTRRRVYE